MSFCLCFLLLSCPASLSAFACSLSLDSLDSRAADRHRNSLNAPTEVVKQIIINIEAGVEVEVTIAA